MAGVPVTHRAVTHEFVVVSGHVAPGHPESLVNWDALAAMSGTIVLLLAVSTGCIVANIYYIQPLLADMARDFGLTVAQIGAVAMVTQVGTGVGMLLFVPLGDKYERRRLIVTLLLASSASLACAALAPNVVALCLACFAVGATAATVHVIVPLAAHLAPPDQRGRVVGSVLSGLLVSVLLARVFSGFVGAQFGWRAVYAVAAVVIVTLAGVLRFALPESAPELSLAWTDLMRSIVSLAREQRVVRQAAILAGLLFFSFSALWTGQLISALGDRIHQVALAYVVFDATGSAIAVGAVFFTATTQ